MRMITCNFFTENFLALSTLYLHIKTELGCQLQMFVKRSVGARRHAALGVGCYTHKNENGDKVSIFPNVRSICSQVTFNSISSPVWIIIKMAYHGALPYLMKTNSIRQSFSVKRRWERCKVPISSSVRKGLKLTVISRCLWILMTLSWL